jgi:FAD/FMN-containing dehydrogenase
MSASPEELNKIDWSKLAHRLRGAVVQPGDERMVLAGKNFSAGKPLSFPRALLLCRGLEDVRTSLEFLTSQRILFSVRSGGHCFGDLSSSDSAIIDLSQMNQVMLKNQLVHVGPGACAEDIGRTLESHGRVIPTGGCPLVAIGGLSLAGGFGFLGRMYGLTTDQLKRMQVVTTGGAVLELSDENEADLFWALRGAGTAGLGVVTELVLRTRPLRKMTVCSGVWHLQDAVNLINEWQYWAPEASRNINLELGLEGPQRPEDPPSFKLFGVILGDQRKRACNLRELRRLLGPLAKKLRTWTLGGRIAVDYLVGLLDYKLEQSWRPKRPFRDIAYQFTRSDFFEEPLSIDAIRDCVARFEAGRRYPQARELELVPWGGEYARQNPFACFMHRAPRLLIRHTVMMGARSTQDLLDHGRDWVDASQRTLQSYANGHTYQGYADLRLDDWAYAYYGDSYPRLQRIKACYDPGDLFHHAQTIRLPTRPRNQTESQLAL